MNTNRNYVYINSDDEDTVELCDFDSDIKRTVNPDKIDVIKEDENEIVLMMSYKKVFDDSSSVKIGSTNTTSISTSTNDIRINDYEPDSLRPSLNQLPINLNDNSGLTAAKNNKNEFCLHFTKNEFKNDFKNDIKVNRSRTIMANRTINLDAIQKRRMEDRIKYLVKGIISDTPSEKDAMKDSDFDKNLQNALSHKSGADKNKTDSKLQTTPLDYDLLKQYRDDLKNAINNKKEVKIKRQIRNNSDNTRHSASNNTRIPMKQGTNIYVSNRKKHEEYAKSERNSTSDDRKLVKQQYLALCIPNVAFENSTKRLSSIRYCNPEMEDFKKPSTNEAVVVPVNLVHKSDFRCKNNEKWSTCTNCEPQCDLNGACGANPNISCQQENGKQKFELSLEELQGIIELVKEREK